jgi:hypothetical protein
LVKETGITEEQARELIFFPAPLGIAAPGSKVPSRQSVSGFVRFNRRLVND